MEKLYVKVVDGQVKGYPMLHENVIQACMFDFPIHYEGVTEEFILSHGYAVFEKPTLKTGEYVSSSQEEIKIILDENNIARPVMEVRQMTQAEKVDAWVRMPRNFDLASSDWTQMADSPLSQEKKAEWAAYRQQLRDLTKVFANVQDPGEVKPPAKPTP